MSKPLSIGTEKQLFLGPWSDDGRDEYLVDSLANVQMRMNPARVTGERLVVNDRPWEGTGMLDMRQFVIKDGNRFRMYYSALPYHTVSADPHDARHDLWTKPNRRILCYAESEDGIHWHKPELGLTEFNGSRANNILLPNDQFGFPFSEVEGACPFIDPAAASSEETYKMFLKISPISHAGGTDEEEDGLRAVCASESLPKGQFAFSSPDGIHWKLMTTQKVNAGPASDTQYSVFWDSQINKYVQYSRAKFVSESQIEYYKQLYPSLPPEETARPKYLCVGRAVSDDFIHWSEEDVVIAPDALDRANSPAGLTRLDFYGGNVSKYGKQAYIALPNAYSHWKVNLEQRFWASKGYAHIPSKMDAQLMTSRDGIQWNRAPERRPFIELGPEGSFWSHQIYPDGNALVVGDELWFYFAGLDVHHKEQGLRVSHGARGRAVLRLDGFISADAGYTGGELVTKPFCFEGKALQLNVATGSGGVVTVEIQDPSGNPLPQFAAADCEEINGNYVRKLVSWRDKPDLGALAGHPVRLRFVMRDAKLYSFQFM